MATVDWSALSDDLLGSVFDAPEVGPDFGDRYEIQDVLGRGGQGTVYRAWDRVIERPVAIKCLRDPGIDQRPMLEEARLLGRLAHPAIPQLLDRGTSPDGGLFVVMQFVEGRRLDRYLAERPFDLGERVRLFRTVAGAVDHAHHRGILHRDLKPENVMVAEGGEPYLVDWGLAAHGGPRAICGTPYFAAPEQLEGQVADRRADVYALGVLLYHIMTGAVPYARPVDGFAEFRRMRATLHRVPIREREARVPRALAIVVETAMAAQPAARYQRVGDLLADLDAFEAGRPLARDLRSGSWRPLLMVAAGLTLFGGGLASGLAWDDPAPSPGGGFADRGVLDLDTLSERDLSHLSPRGEPGGLPALDERRVISEPLSPILRVWHRPPATALDWLLAVDRGPGPLGGRTRTHAPPLTAEPSGERPDLPTDLDALLPELTEFDHGP